MDGYLSIYVSATDLKKLEELCKRIGDGKINAADIAEVVLSHGIDTCYKGIVLGKVKED